MRRALMMVAVMVAVSFNTGCASLKGQFSTTNRVHGALDVTNDTVFTSLSTLQDVEKVAFQSGMIPEGDYTAKTATTPEVCTGHKCFSAKLVTALQAGKIFNESLMKWTPGTPMPSTVNTVMTAIMALTKNVIAVLPDSPTKSKLLMYSGAVETAVLVVVTQAAGGQ